MIQILHPRIITFSPFENAKIISYRLLVLAKSTNRCIIVQRKHTIEFLLLLLGQYRPAILSILLSNLTKEEYDTMKFLVDKDINVFKEVYLSTGLDEKDLDYSYIRFNEAQSFINKFN